MTTLVLALFLQDPETLVERWWEDDLDVREQASRDLVRLGAAAVPVLVRTLESGDAEVRSRAADALARIGAPSALALLSAAQGSHPTARAVAKDALFLLAPNVGSDLLVQYPQLQAYRPTVPSIQDSFLLEVLEANDLISVDCDPGIGPSEETLPWIELEGCIPCDPE